MVRIHVLHASESDAEFGKAHEGTYMDGKDCTIITKDADVYGIEPDSKERQLLAKFRKRVFPADLTTLAWDAFHKAAAPSRNRGAAAGPIKTDSKFWKGRKPIQTSKWSAQYKQRGKTSKMRVSNIVFSSVLGYFESSQFLKLPCRMTSYTQTYFKGYKKGIPFLQAIDREFKNLAPDRHAAQLARAKKTPEYQIDHTAFSSLTINRNFRTALHKDAGDFRGGFGNLTVIERGAYHGGFTIFPRFGVGFDLRQGDFLAMNVHEWHCNTPLYETAADKAINKKLPQIYRTHADTGIYGTDFPFTRISFVCYLREKLINCNVHKTEAYYRKIGFNPERGRTRRRATRGARGAHKTRKARRT